MSGLVPREGCVAATRSKNGAASAPSHGGAVRLPVKLEPPERSSLVSRSRLHALADAARGSVLWVSGPAGSGKSSFVSTWCHALDAPFVWYRVDADDMDVAAFFGTLARVVPSASAPARAVPHDDSAPGAAALPAWSVEQGMNPVAFAQRFFAAFFTALDPAVVLVLDNVHDAAASPVFCAVLEALARAKPAAVTVVMSSREVPSGQLLAVAAHTRFATITWSDLRCTDVEAHDLARAWNLAAPTPAVLALADGWISALVIMLRYPNLLPRNEPQGLPPPSEVFAALAGHAFETLPDNPREVLMLGAFAPRFDAGAITSASGYAKAHDVLERVWRAHFFLERGPENGRATYLGHPLLRAFLQQRAHTLWPRDALDARVRRLAAALAAAGDVEAAAATYESIEAWDAVAPLFLAQCPGWMQAGQLATVAEGLRKLDRAPAASLDAVAPALDTWRGVVAMFQGDAASLEWLERSHRGHLERGQVVEALLAVVTRMEAYFLLWEQWDTAASWADELERLYDMVVGALPRPLLVRVLAGGASLMFPCFSHRLVRRLADKAREIVTTTNDPHEQLALAGFVIGQACWMGEMNTAREVALIAAGAMDRARIPPSLAIQSALWIVIAEYVEGRAADKRIAGFADRAFELAERNDLTMWIFHCWLQRSGLSSSLGDQAAADAAMHEAEKLTPGHRGARQMILLGNVMRLTGRGDWKGVVELAEAALAANPDLGGDVMIRESVRIQLAGAHAMLGNDAATVETILAPTDRLAERTGSRYLQVMLGFVRAAMHVRHGRDADALAHLSQAMRIAREAGFRHFHPAWSVPFFRPLLACALDAGIETDWAIELIRRQRVPPPAGGHAAWPLRLRIRVLGGFDVRIDEQSIVQPTRGKQPVRVLELLSFLAMHGHEPVKLTAIADELWSEAEGDTATGALEITVHRARKLLDEPSSILLSQGTLRLNPDLVAVDLVELTSRLSRIEAALPSRANNAAALLQSRDELLAAFTGAPLAWNVERASSKLVRQTVDDTRRVARTLADAMARSGMQAEAREMARALAQRDPRHFEAG